MITSCFKHDKHEKKLTLPISIPNLHYKITPQHDFDELKHKATLHYHIQLTLQNNTSANNSTRYIYSETHPKIQTANTVYSVTIHEEGLDDEATFKSHQQKLLLFPRSLLFCVRLPLIPLNELSLKRAIRRDMPSGIFISSSHPAYSGDQATLFII